MFTVVTYLWKDSERLDRGYTFSHEHVRILKRMVERNLTVPHRFVCVSDEPIDGVNTVPLDWRKHVPGTVFLRLMQHRPDIADLLGQRILSLDVDIVITGNIDHIAQRPEDFVIWRNPNFPTPKRAFFQGSVQLFNAGARTCLWEDFDPQATPKWVNWRFGGREQAWISERLEWTEATFSAQDGIFGAGRLGGAGVYSDLPKEARIVSFPGARAPWQEDTQSKYPWIKEFYK